jgi:hypothetical protein
MAKTVASLVGITSEGLANARFIESGASMGRIC